MSESIIGKGNEAGLGHETNAQVARALMAGDFNTLVDVISENGNSDAACDVVLKSMFSFHHVDRATDTVKLTQVAIQRNPEVMAALIRYTYHKQQLTERFWQDPHDDHNILLVDRNGNIITCPKNISQNDAGYQKLESLTSYTFLTGPEKGKTVNNHGNYVVPRIQANC